MRLRESFAAEVPSLVDEHGVFRPSDFYRKAASDPAVLADVELEAETQYQAFVELVGREPDWGQGDRSFDSCLGVRG